LNAFRSKTAPLPAALMIVKMVAPFSSRARWYVSRPAATLWKKAPAGLSERLENAVSFDVPHVRTASVAISVAILFAIGSAPTARAATIEEVAHCRAIQNNHQRFACFNALKAHRAAIPPRTKREATTPPIPPVVQEPTRDDPATTSAIDHRSAIPGRPLCIDHDALTAMLVAGVLASSSAQATTNGCQTVPDDAQVEILERIPSGLHFLRVIKVKVISPKLPEPTVGFTVEIDR
jgi:hypothetical protein